MKKNIDVLDRVVLVKMRLKQGKGDTWERKMSRAKKNHPTKTPRYKTEF